MTDRALDEAAAAQEALSGEEEALREVLLCQSIDDLLILLVGLQERRVALEGRKDPGLERIIHRVQRQTNIEHAIRTVREWFGRFRDDRAAEIRRLKAEGT